MSLVTLPIIFICWGIFFIVWVLAAIFTKRTVYHQSGAERLRYMGVIVIGWYFLFRGHRLPYPFNLRIIPETYAILVLSSILCVCGLVLCLWARAILGRNWSGTVTLKENHELIVRGPYRFVRHPIYTCLLAMMIATAIAQGHLAGILALVLVFISFWIKLLQEEAVMLKQFGKQYVDYQKRVKRIVPFVL